MARTRREPIPELLGKLVQFPMSPELHKEIKIAALREDISAAEWIHQHFCEYFQRHDLELKRTVAATA